MRKAAWICTLALGVLNAIVLIAVWWTQTPPEPVAEQETPTRETLDESVWSQEVLAQEYELPFVKLWDRLRESQSKWELLADFPFQTLVLGAAGDTETLDLGIQSVHYGVPTESMNHDQWHDAVHRLHNEGFEIIQTEWHHSRFDVAKDNSAESAVSFVIHAANATQKKRFILSGEINVKWQRPIADQSPVAGRIEVRRLNILQNTGELAFEEVLDARVEREGTFLAAYDLNKDGLSEIVFGSTIYWNKGDGQFKPEDLSPSLAQIPNAGVIADFTNDGQADFLFTFAGSQHPRLLVGDQRGRFSSPPRTVNVGPALFVPKVFSAGDVDADGDVDVWIAQYKPPYRFGQMPTPYYDANDGFPACLLLNDGKGHFTDVTSQAGLSAKRFRRTYSGSLADLDDDGDLDLIVVSDFSGIDVYHNDGKGQFTDVTNELVDDRHLFGMSHTFADFNGDGKTDFFVTGMGSTTARRLDHMKLGREEFPKHQEMRNRMGYGNRMYLSKDSVFRQPSFRDQVARTGWSWGCTSPDFDNDGDRDIYVGNGHVSGSSAKDYCSQFWCHDIYTGTSKEDPVLGTFFQKLHGSLSREMSWNGFEHNSLLMNLNGGQFINVAFLLGVAFEFDTRNVVADDLDNDGRPDLLVVGIDRSGPKPESVLHVLRNNLNSTNHWIGVKLHDGGAGRSTVGTRVTLDTTSGRRIARVVTGDSHVAQHSATVHFGLGNETGVNRIEILWPNGETQTIAKPKLDQYHAISVGSSKLEQGPVEPR